jgi:hypothetical protein
MTAARRTVQSAGDRNGAAQEAATRMMSEFPVETDWLLQDTAGNAALWLAAPDDKTEALQKVIARVLAELGDRAAPLQGKLDELVNLKASSGDSGWLDLYAEACRLRRAMRLQVLAAKWPRIAFAKHYPMGGSHYAYTEGQSDAQAERHFVPGTALCVLELEGAQAKVRTLIDDPKGVIRDVDVSSDGRRILFAWKKSLLQDDYHLYEMDAAGGGPRQLTFGLGFADYEPCYLPNGDILFNSTRCVQTVDCWHTEVSNLYCCDKDGKHLRRISFDQVHTNYPTVMDDGRVVYTRWDYNDRGQIYPQPLFQMNSDGTNQSEFYGNSSWFPTTVIHARGIPGTQKVLAIFTGHHSRQPGKLGILDPAKGRQENQGAQLVAPVRPTPADRIDGYGQAGELFQCPYPLDETRFLVSYAPLGWKRPLFGIYFMDVDGRRELLASDPKIACGRMVPLAPRPLPHVRASVVDYRKPNGTYYMQDVYAGPGLAGVPRGTIKKLRVVSIQYRPADIGANGSGGPAGGAMASLPCSIDNGCWDVKVVLGSAKIHDDGSAAFVVPARTPVYFQAIDERGRAVQTMRTWSTLQPGEKSSCVGCHEDKNAAASVEYRPTLAMKAGPQPLESFYGAPRGFSYPKEVQPVLDRHCVRCHDQDQPAHFGSASAASRESKGDEVRPAFSLQGTATIDGRAQRRWSVSYVALTQKGRPNPVVNWLNVQSVPPMLPPYYAGSAKSRLMTMLDEGHYGVRVSAEEYEKLACWIDLLVPYCGDYAEAHAWSAAQVKKYNHFLTKRLDMEMQERRNLEDWIGAPLPPPALPAPPPAVLTQ